MFHRIESGFQCSVYMFISNVISSVCVRVYMNEWAIWQKWQETIAKYMLIGTERVRFIYASSIVPSSKIRYITKRDFSARKILICHPLDYSIVCGSCHSMHERLLQMSQEIAIWQKNIASSFRMVVNIGSSASFSSLLLWRLTLSRNHNYYKILCMSREITACNCVYVCVSISEKMRGVW